MLGHSFAYVADFVFLRYVWIRTLIAAVASRRATNLANPLPDLATQLPDLATHFPNLATHLPDLSIHFPNRATHLPDLTTSLSDLATNLPDLATRLPDLATHLQLRHMLVFAGWRGWGCWCCWAGTSSTLSSPYPTITRRGPYSLTQGRSKGSLRGLGYYIEFKFFVNND